MLSKWFPWDFFKHNPSIIDQNTKGLYAIEVFDPYLEKMVTFRLKSYGHKFNNIVGNEVTPDWLSSKFKELDLFSFNQETQTEETSFWLVLNAGDIPKESRQLILEKEINFSSHVFVLSFAKKNTFFEEIAKVKEFTALKMEEPRFWETSKYLSFLCDQLKINIDSTVQQYLLESVPNYTQDFIQALSKLKRFNNKWGSDKAQLKLLKELILKTRVDQFELASKFSQRNKIYFYKSLIDTELDYDSLRSLFNFMQGHLLKLYDPSYMQKKARLSKYDKEIDAHSKLWKQSELLDEVDHFTEFEILAKKKSESLLTLMRSEYFSSL